MKARFAGVRITVGVLLGSLLSLGSAVPAQTTKLHPDLTGTQAVVSFTVSPDGESTAFIVGDNTTDTSALYINSVMGGTPVQLNGPIAPGATGPYPISTQHPRFTADGSRVVFVSDEEEELVGHLYSVPVAGGALSKITTHMTDPGDSTGTFEFIPNSDRVAYMVANSMTGRLYSNSVLGGSPVELSAPLGALTPSRRAAPDFKISSDGSYILVRGIDDDSGDTDLYRIELPAGTLTELMDAHWIPSGAMVFAKDANSAIVRIEETDGVFGQFGVNLATGQVARLNPQGGANHVFFSELISAAGNKASFTYIDLGGKTSGTYAVNLDGSSRINVAQPGDESIGVVSSLSPDGQKAILRVTPSGASSNQSFEMSTSTGARSLITTGNPAWSSTNTDPSGETVYAPYRPEDTGPFEQVCRYNYTTGSFDLSPPLVHQSQTVYVESAFESAFLRGSPDGDAVIFLGKKSQASGTPLELFSYQFSTQNLRRLSDPMVANGGIEYHVNLHPVSFALAGEIVVYAAEQDEDLRAELYASSQVVVPPLSADAWMHYE